MSVIEFPMTRAKKRDRKLYLQRGQVVPLAATATTLSRILERARYHFFQNLAEDGKYGLTLDFIEASAEIVTRRTASRYGAGRSRRSAGRYRGGDIVKTRAEGYFGCVIDTRTTDMAAPGLGTSFSVIEYHVDFQGIRNWYTAADLETADKREYAWGAGL